jgi:outer membrane receptor protein involved in Fe transport
MNQSMIVKLISGVLILTAPFSATYSQSQELQQDTDSLPASVLQEVVVSANREAVKRSDAPMAITKLSAKTIQETKATSIDQLLNKVSGVNMVNLGNEQHQMSIRQPITTKSFFLYLEDGIPIRTTGLFNHNALIEVNMAGIKDIEVIKGPSSSMYGSEAIGGVVNFITAAPTKTPTFRISSQANDLGYKRQEVQGGFTAGKLGVALSGYYADKNNNYLDHNDFHKGTFTFRLDYRFSETTTLSNKITWVDYYNEMPGGIDSVMFAQKKFKNPQTFTYRSVKALRYNSTLLRNWTDHSKTSLTLIYRDNVIGQNPAYRIKDDYRKVNGEWRGRKDLAHGEINTSDFNSYAIIAQHKQQFNWLKAMLIGGVSLDISPSGYNADYIRIHKDTLTQQYTGYEKNDSVLSQYKTNITNYAGYINIELNPVEKMHVVASLRYDRFRYDFNNHLQPSSFSGSPDTINFFNRLSSKIGFTYNFTKRTGVYANYSEGFIPPQVTEMYTGVTVPCLQPSVARNYEVGGWMEIIKGKLSADISFYELMSTNEVISAKMDDGSFANANAGKTSHKGIELGLFATPVRELAWRWSGAFSRHKFINYVEKGNDYGGNDMAGAPRLTYNTEVWYRPKFARGLRVGADLQHVGRYFADANNTATYDGYNTLNIRAGYQYRNAEIWINAMNVTGNYYANNVTKSASGYSYTLADPRSINVGIAYDLGNLFRSNK